MPNYQCKYLKPSGRDVVEEKFAAGSKAELRRTLESREYFVLEIRRLERSLFSRSLWMRRPVRPRDFYVFNQEFSVLMRAGLPIIKCLDAILEKGRKSEMMLLLKGIREDVATGESLSGAFRKRADHFSHLYIASLEAGERSGNVPEAIGRYLSFMKKMAELRQKVVSAMVYPAILTLVSMATLMFLMLHVVPTFTESFLEAGAKLPAITQILIGISRFVRSHIVIIGIALCAACAALMLMRQSERGRTVIDRTKLHLPLAGRIYWHFWTAMLSRTLATVLGGGTPLLESLKISTAVVDNVVLRATIQKVWIALEQGEGFAAALAQDHVLPGMAVRMIAAGEGGGALIEVLNEVADFYEADVSTRLGVLTAALEPGLMVVMGVMIGGIVLAMYLPIFELAGTIG